MNFNINRNVLLPALLFVSSVIEKRQTLPILANLYFKLEDGRMVIVGSDLEVEITQIIDGVDCSNNGSFTVLGRKITDIVRTLPENAQITFDYDEKQNLLIQSGKSRYKLNTLIADDYPRIKTDEWEERFKIEAITLKETLDKVSFAMALHDARYFLNGLSLIVNNNELTATATDGHRLARSAMKLEVDAETNRDIIIPRKAIHEINKLFDSKENYDSRPNDDQPENSDLSMITFEYSRNHIRLSVPGKVLISKLIDGNYPKFTDVIEANEDSVKLTLDRKQLLNALNEVAVITDERFRGVRMTLIENKLVISANTTEHQQASGEIDIDYSGDELVFGYNIMYLLDACKAVQTNKIEMTLDKQSNIGYFKQPKDNYSIWIVMSMSL